MKAETMANKWVTSLIIRWSFCGLLNAKFKLLKFFTVEHAS